jgi:hypothetical protein
VYVGYLSLPLLLLRTICGWSRDFTVIPYSRWALDAYKVGKHTKFVLLNEC